MKKILFMTGTRADYGKIKSLIQSVEKSKEFEAYIYVSGMHLLQEYGSTYREVLKDGYKNVYVAYGLVHTRNMSYDLGNVICNLTGYVINLKPDMIIVHGDRIDALAGAVVGALNNIIVAHIEGGELSGTIDESIRHAISKLAHLHLVCNEEAKNRLIQLGEEKRRIFVMGSPDIDIMLSNQLPSLEITKAHYEIAFEKYAIFMYHPVTTEYINIGEKIQNVVSALIQSERNYIVVLPNNDLGTEIIQNEFKRFNDSKNFVVFPSIRFEYFLTLLKNADFVIGNSSAGVRETSIYGIPDIDIGTRQSGRYSLDLVDNIQHVNEDEKEIIQAIGKIDFYRKKSFYYGDGKSTQRFMSILNSDIWEFPMQKHFVNIQENLL